MIGFENSSALLLSIPCAILVVIFLKKEEQSYLVHPWASFIHGRRRSSRWDSYASFVFLLISVSSAIIVLAQPWQGLRENLKKEQARMIGVLLDVSGSMSGDPLRAAVEATKYLMDKKPDDRINLNFFASESVPTIFGTRSDYLTDDRVKAFYKDLGGSTVVTQGLFIEFVAMASEDQLFTNEELGKIYVRAITNNKTDQATRIRSLQTYLDVLLQNKPIKPSDRLVILVSDCDLSYNDYDMESLLRLYKLLNVRIEAVCISSSSPSMLLSGEADKVFMKGIKDSGGHITQLDVSQLQSPQEMEKNLRAIIERIDKQKPREVSGEVSVQRQSISHIFLLISLASLVLSGITRLIKRFRIIS